MGWRSAVALVLAVGAWGHARGAPPPQFRVWGAAAPPLPPPPAGWRHVDEPADALLILAPTAAEVSRGYVLFARDPFEPVLPGTVPAPFERCGGLRAFATPGEYEPLAFGMHALGAMADLQVAVSELRARPGGIIPTDHVDVRVARSLRVVVDAGARTYREQAFLLEKRNALHVRRGETTLVWLTVKVPDRAAAGEYRGRVTVRARGREPAVLPICVTVLPFTLPAAPVEMAMFGARLPDDEVELARQLTDLREHGVFPFGCGLSVEVKTRDQRYGEDDAEATRAHCKRVMDGVKSVYGGWRFPPILEVGHQIICYWDQGKGWFSFWPHSPAIDADLSRAIQGVLDLAQAEGWPTPRLYLLDEAGAHGLLDEAAYYYGLVHRRFPRLVTWADVGGGLALGHDEIGRLADVVDCFSTNRFTPEVARALVSRGRPYGVYNGAGPTPAGARFFFGFYGWKTGASQIAQWAYRFGNGVAAGNGLRAEDEGYIEMTPGGLIPSIMWEAVREGVDDYRYLSLLWRMAAEARLSPRASTRAAAVRAEKSARALLARVPWTFQALRYPERTPAPAPATLRKWRRRIVAQIIALSKQSGDGRPGPRVTGTHSPFDFAWAVPVRERASHGPELLPPSGFEDTAGPWRVETWNGRGSGRLDSAEHHGGRHCMRVEVPPDQGSDATTVVVWPRWGSGGLNLALDAGRVYEFAAWVKPGPGRGVPELRMPLPTGGGQTVAAGEETGPGGWRRVWIRVESAARTVPAYLAVWVQGPGVVWIDDLSLREVILPPMALLLDQEEYDGEDALGVATVSVRRPWVRGRVRFRLASSKGRRICEAIVHLAASTPARTLDRAAVLLPLGASPAGVARAAFSPPRLKPGVYRLSAELLGPPGTVLSATTVPFRVLPPVPIRGRWPLSP